jgi:hypothetical protein
MTERQKQALLELVSTIFILAVYWISTQPEWKIQHYKNLVLERLRAIGETPGDETPLHIRLAMEKLRHDISQWEHEQKGNA